MPRKLKRGVEVTISKISGDVKHTFKIGDKCTIITFYSDAKCCTLRREDEIIQTVPVKDFKLNARVK